MEQNREQLQQKNVASDATSGANQVLRPLGGTDELDRANAHLWNKM
jgi:hypothetical protein